MQGGEEATEMQGGGVGADVHEGVQADAVAEETGSYHLDGSI